MTTYAPLSSPAERAERSEVARGEGDPGSSGKSVLKGRPDTSSSLMHLIIVSTWIPFPSLATRASLPRPGMTILLGSAA